MARELSAEEQQELDTLRETVERAIADGVLTKAERDSITAAMKADGQVTFEELALAACRTNLSGCPEAMQSLQVESEAD